MTSNGSLTGDVRYRLTPVGYTDLHNADTCVCELRMSGLLLACDGCGTVYGFVRDAGRPRAQKFAGDKPA